jgi:hypothetical protein
MKKLLTTLLRWLGYFAMNAATVLVAITLWREGMPTCALGLPGPTCAGYLAGHVLGCAVFYIPGGLLLWGARRSER